MLERIGRPSLKAHTDQGSSPTVINNPTKIHDQDPVLPTKVDQKSNKNNKANGQILFGVGIGTLATSVIVCGIAYDVVLKKWEDFRGTLGFLNSKENSTDSDLLTATAGNYLEKSSSSTPTSTSALEIANSATPTLTVVPSETPTPTSTSTEIPTLTPTMFAEVSPTESVAACTVPVNDIPKENETVIYNGRTYLITKVFEVDINNSPNTCEGQVELLIELCPCSSENTATPSASGTPELTPTKGVTQTPPSGKTPTPKIPTPTIAPTQPVQPTEHQPGLPTPNVPTPMPTPAPVEEVTPEPDENPIPTPAFPTSFIHKNANKL